jgi:hypothetical protein
VIQAAKRKARGYGKKHFKTMAYLLSGKLDLNGFYFLVTLWYGANSTHNCNTSI